MYMYVFRLFWNSLKNVKDCEQIIISGKLSMSPYSKTYEVSRLYHNNISYTQVSQILNPDIVLSVIPSNMQKSFVVSPVYPLTEGLSNSRLRCDERNCP
jgi:hypothetical protein